MTLSLVRYLFIYFVFPFLYPCFSCKAASSIDFSETCILNRKEIINDTVEIQGKFVNHCTIPGKIVVTRFSVMGSRDENIPVNKDGEFSYYLAIDNPCQITLFSGAKYFDFLITPKEKKYSIEIACDEKKNETISIKNSYENNAFVPFYALCKSLRESLQKYSDRNIAEKDTFLIVRNLFLDYQDKVKAIALKSPNSFTGSLLCPSEILPKSSFVSIEALRKSFLKRELFSNPLYYTSFISSRVFVNYMYLLSEEDTSFIPFNEAMTITLRNPDAAKSFQQLLFDLFYLHHKEDLLVKYQQWADHHSTSMYNAAVRARLWNLESCIKGSGYIEIKLKDPNGIQRKLSEDVASGKLTVLIFYGPNCSHCQEQLPELVPLWNKFKDKGLRIYAVGYDSDVTDWNNFIKNKSTTEWTNVFESKEGSRPSIKYIVTYTPMFILIDSSGKIITRFASIEDVLKEIPKRLE